MRVVDLGSICSSCDNIKWKDVPRDKAYKYIDLTSVDRDTKSIIEPQSISADTAPSRAQRIIRQGDILFATTRPTLRRLCIVSPDYDGEICSTGFCVLRPDLSKVLPKWVFILLSTDAFYDYIGPLQTGATYPAVTDKDVRAFAVPVPPLPEQQRIVDILDKEFAKIDALKANAEKSLQAAKDLFQASLKKELEPKEGWTQETLSAVCTEMFAGGDAPKNQMTDTPSKEYPIPIIANAVENEGLYGYTSIARVSVPSITIAGRGSGTGYVFRRRYSYFPIVRLIVIIPNDNKVCLDYLYFAIKSLNIQSSGSAIPQLTIPMIKNYLIAYPAKSIQEVIVKRLTQMEEGYFQLKENYQKTLTLCDDLKQSLLRKAFNGEL